MRPTVCMACGGLIHQHVAENPNVCEPCFLGVSTEPMAVQEVSTLEPRLHASEVSHPPRRRSPVIGDHSHERKTRPSLPRRKH